MSKRNEDCPGFVFDPGPESCSLIPILDPDPACGKYSGIFEYIGLKYLFCNSFVTIFLYKYIPTFVRVKFILIPILDPDPLSLILGMIGMTDCHAQ